MTRNTSMKRSKVFDAKRNRTVTWNTFCWNTGWRETFLTSRYETTETLWYILCWMTRNKILTCDMKHLFFFDAKRVFLWLETCCRELKQFLLWIESLSLEPIPCLKRNNRLKRNTVDLKRNGFWFEPQRLRSNWNVIMRNRFHKKHFTRNKHIDANWIRVGWVELKHLLPVATIRFDVIRTYSLLDVLHFLAIRNALTCNAVSTWNEMDSRETKCFFCLTWNVFFSLETLFVTWNT